MVKKYLGALLVQWLITAVFSFGLVQPHSSSIRGRIVDSERKPLAGAFIYLRSPSMLGLRTYITAETGLFRLPGLPAGKYSITVEMPGYNTIHIDEIIIEVGKSMTLSIPLETSRTEEDVTREISSPTLDVRAAKTSEILDRPVLQYVPLQRDIQSIIGAAAGVVPERAVYPESFFTHGSQGAGNTYALEGMPANSPFDRQLLTNINFDTVEEVEVETAGHPVDVEFSAGGYVNVITRSGGNSMGGGFNFYHTSAKISSPLRSKEELKSPGAAPPIIDKNIWDFSLSLEGLVFEDILWFFGNARALFHKQIPPFIPWTDPLGTEHDDFERTNKELLGFFKLSGRFIPELTASAAVSFVDRYRSVDEAPVDWNLPLEATRVLNHEKNTTVSGHLHYIIDQNTHASLKAGYIHHLQPLRLNENGLESARYFDEGTGRLWGSGSFHETRLQKRFQATASLTRFQDRFLGGNHELRVGAEYEYAYAERGTWKPNNLMVNYYYGNPYYFGLATSPETANTVGKGFVSFAAAGILESALNAHNELRRFGFFGQDSVTFARRLTFHLALRFDHSDTTIPGNIKTDSGHPVSLKIGEELIEPAYEVNPFAAAAISEWKKVIVWNSLSPRLGLSLDIFGTGKSLLKASFSRSRDHLTLDDLSELNPLHSYRSHQFYWFDENMDGEVDEEDTFTLFSEDYRLYNSQYYVKRIAPESRAPSTDEVTVGFHQELIPDFSLRLSFIQKTRGNVLSWVLYDPDGDRDWYSLELDRESWWVPFETIVPGVDDYPDTPLRLYFRSGDAPLLFDRLRNVAELKSKYQAFEIALRKRMSHKWQFQGSLVISRTTGNTGFGEGSGFGLSGGALTPNHFVNLPEDARLFYDRPLAVKLMGAYQLPAGFFLSFYYTYMSGSPWARSVTVIPPSSWAEANNADPAPVHVFLEEPGTRRTEPYSNLDIRLGRWGKLSIFFDVSNVLGTTRDLTFLNDGGFWFPDDENTTQGSRLLSSTYLNLTSLFGTRTLRLNFHYRF